MLKQIIFIQYIFKRVWKEDELFIFSLDKIQCYSLINLTEPVGLEPTTTRLTVGGSTNWATVHWEDGRCFYRNYQCSARDSNPQDQMVGGF